MSESTIDIYPTHPYIAKKTGERVYANKRRLRWPSRVIVQDWEVRWYWKAKGKARIGIVFLTDREFQKTFREMTDDELAAWYLWLDD